MQRLECKTCNVIFFKQKPKNRPCDFCSQKCYIVSRKLRLKTCSGCGVTEERPGEFPKTRGRCYKCHFLFNRNQLKKRSRQPNVIEKEKERQARTVARYNNDPEFKIKRTEQRRKSYRKIGKDYEMKRYYKISEREYKCLLKIQDGKCFICEETSNRKLCVDHNHKTGKVRALLCNGCNSALGFLRENPNIALRMHGYILMFNNTQINYPPDPNNMPPPSGPYITYDTDRDSTLDLIKIIRKNPEIFSNIV